MYTNADYYPIQTNGRLIQGWVVCVREELGIVRHTPEHHFPTRKAENRGCFSYDPNIKVGQKVYVPRLLKWCEVLSVGPTQRLESTFFDTIGLYFSSCK